MCDGSGYGGIMVSFLSGRIWLFLILSQKNLCRTFTPVPPPVRKVTTGLVQPLVCVWAAYRRDCDDRPVHVYSQYLACVLSSVSITASEACKRWSFTSTSGTTERRLKCINEGKWVYGCWQERRDGRKSMQNQTNEHLWLCSKLAPVSSSFSASATTVSHQASL